jgi:S-DNA-T family DNA segregation ATPase FtsK/SpoIIIE
MHGTIFYRPARSYPPVLSTTEMVISSPPIIPQVQSGAVSWLQYLLPVVGGLGSLIFVFAYQANPLMIVAGISMAVCSIGGGVIMGIVQRRTQKKTLKQQRSLYLEYLSLYRTRLQSLERQQCTVSARLYPDYDKLMLLVEERTCLWERRATDIDFLQVRIGIGPVPLSCRVRLDLGTNMMVQYMPELRSQAEALVVEFDYLNDMPMVMSLRLTNVLAINGKRSATRALVRALLCQIVAFHSPEDVRCMIYFPEAATEEWHWLKWLPHVRRLRQIKSEKRFAPDQLCMLANTVDDVNELLLNQIKPELDRRRRLSEDKDRQQDAHADYMSPHLFVLLDDFSPHNALGQLAELDVLFRDAAKFGVTVLCLVDDLSQEPTQVQARLSLSNIGVVDYEEIKLGGQRIEGILPDAVEPAFCERMARHLAPLSLVEAGVQQDLSQDVRLLELLHLASVDRLHVSEAWRPRERPDLLRVPIGSRGDGEPLLIDFKEAAEKGMGPHGLVVGATGSGKSELLRTIVTSLAMTHDPQTVSFVLIDFKGGASFADFVALPHVAGIITNLQGDVSLVDRVYYSLLGEQQRRQRMLHEAGNLDNIKQYQAKWHMNPAMESMPHLFIIADEFAELIANRPDFLELFITMGRVGRSLGLHLLLATQRLDEGRIRGLEGHLRYRICLRTFSASESSSVLGRPDAYYLPSAPGVGYFKVDTDTYHMFKTALISVPYVSSQEQVSPMARIREFTAAGKLVKYQAPDAATSCVETTAQSEEPSELHTEMDVVIDRLSHGASTHLSLQSVHQVWLPLLDKRLSLNMILQRCRRADLDGHTWDKEPPFGELRIPVGLLDMPLQQAQEPLLLDFSGTGGHIALVGAPQSGKSTFLRTLVTSFMVTHAPNEVQIYCIDLGGGLLRVFESSPHVGEVCGKSDRDKVRRVIRLMRKVIEDREFLFREHSIDSMTAFRARRRAGEFADFPFGDVFLVIDNFAQFLQEFDQLEPVITELVAGGLTYGVHLVIAANRWAEIRSKLRDNIGMRLELRLNDPMDSEFGKAAASTLPIGVPGRGLNKDKLQFQIALPLVDSCTEEELAVPQQALEAFMGRVHAHWYGPVAPPILMLPTCVRWEDLPSPATLASPPLGVPLGLEEFRLDPLYIDLIHGGPHFLILGDSECGKTTLLRAWMRGIEQRYTPQEVSFAIIDYRKTLVDFAESKHFLTYAYNASTMTECLGNFKVDLTKRLAVDANLPLTQLRAPKRWTGKHYFLFVDDYDALVTSTSPLAPLVEYLLSGRDIGFHLIVARRIGGIGRTSFDAVLQRLREMGTAAILMSGDPQEGRIMYGQAAMQLPPGRGYLVQRNHPPTLMQAALTEPAYAQDVD